MLKKLPKENMGSSNLGWLESRFHFSFADYRNSENINFGVLRVLNDDIIHPKSGFEMHPHHDMEIVSYVVKGEITHKDSMGNEETLKRGEVQYMSAGNGIVHSEHNKSSSEDLRLLQIWIIPPKKNLQTLYGSHPFKKEQRKNSLLNIVSSQEGSAAIKLHQDINIFVSELNSGKALAYTINTNRQLYFMQIEGRSNINGIELNNGDAMQVTQETSLDIQALEKSHFLFIEMAEG
jgi:redox-sensitive bicupin YhaK (pirin superfamily)